MDCFIDTYVFDRDCSVPHGTDFGYYLVDVGAVLWVLSQHGAYEFLDPV